MVSAPSWRKPIFAAMKFSDHITTISATEMAMAGLPGRFSFVVGGATGSSQPDFIDRAALDQIEARREADAGSVGNAYGALRRDADLRLDDVFAPITAARGDIPGERKIRQRGEGNVVGAPDARFEHPAAPHRHLVLLAKVVNAPRHGVAAHAPQRHLDDAAGTPRQRRARLLLAVDSPG